MADREAQGASYDHRAIEARWQAYWDEHRTFATPTDRTRPKFYVLDMFPYPSGAGLHVGHPKGYVGTDIVARARRMMGQNVLRVMGWDSFGLPAERQAVKEGKHPREITERNIATFKNQLRMLGLSYDWERELATSEPIYYRWTQWIFLELFRAGLAYKKKVPVNWCPAQGTVLANEEVVDGKYVETGEPVERREMEQWMLQITKYADRLLDGLDAVDWPEGIKKLQRDWIGKSQGADVVFDVPDPAAEKIEVFTTRPDTLFGGTYVVLAPEHPLVAKLTTDAQRAEVEAYVDKASKRSERDRTTEAADAEKTGAFTGSHAINPVNGARIPIWIADYVLATYGTGAVFACPAHDERDHAFAKKFDLPIVEVVEGGDVQKEAYVGDGPHVNSEFLDGLDVEEAKSKVIAWLEERGKGKGTIQYKLRDWLFSRQRYWGEPFPVIELEDGAVKPLSDEALPVELPELDDFKPTAEGEPPLARATEWVKTTDPETGAPAKRELNTMPQWAGSCWYYLRFISPTRTDVAWDPEEEKYWMPVDLYVGGAEHAVLHLLYARFWHQVLYDRGHVSTPEPFARLFNQGMIHAYSFREVFSKCSACEHTWRPAPDGAGACPLCGEKRIETIEGKYFYPHEVDREQARTKECGHPVREKLEKMSKSKCNVATPDEVSERYGADALRLYEVFMGPLEDGAIWELGEDPNNPSPGCYGTRRFLERAWRLVVDPDTGDISSKIVDGPVENAEVERALHVAIKKVTEGVTETLRFNTAVSDMMVFVNEATRASILAREWIERFVLILSPFAPHIGEELWARLGHAESLAYAEWPKHDESKLKVATVEIAVQINGKVKDRITVEADMDAKKLEEHVLGLEKVVAALGGKAPKLVKVVPNRLVNIVVGK